MRRILFLSAVLAALLTASAAQAANPVVSALARSMAAQSSVVDMQVKTTARGTTLVLTGTGTVRGQEAKMSMRTTAGGRTVAMDVIMLRERGGYVMYVRSPLFGAQLPKGKTWVRFDLERGAQSLGVDFSSLVESSQTLAPLQRGIVSTKLVGHESVGGKSAAHYRAVVDPHRAAAALPDYAKQLAAVERAAGVRLGRMTQEVWVGADGRVRRIRSTTPTVVQGVRATSVQTLTYQAYDVPVSISAPPAAQVFQVG